MSDSKVKSVDSKSTSESSSVDANPAVENLRNYLRIRSEHPNIDYGECLTYLRGQAAELGLPVQVFEVVPRKPVVVMTLEGLEPALPSVLLNSHMDVVPVFENSWKYPPFEARIVDGIIYARGVQDMKSVAVQYIEAVRKLKSSGVRLKRTLHLSFVPDEEIGGHAGMGEFVKTQHFRDLNVGFVLDEGIASADGDYQVFNGERAIWSVKIICPGKSGHGSLLLEDNCAEKLRYIIDKFMDLRAESKKKLADNPNLTIGDVTTVNLTILEGGVQINVIPEQFVAHFNIRLALSVDHKEFENMIQRWCSEAGDNVSCVFEQKDSYSVPTKVDNTNPFWLAFKDTADKLKLPLKLRTFPGGTDSRYLRDLAIPALGFTPIINTEPGLHQHNESLSVETYLKGIDIFYDIVKSVANVS